MESRFQADNDKEMHLTQNEGKSVVAERSTRALTNTIQNYMNSSSKTEHIDNLVDIVIKYSNTYHSTYGL